MGDGPTYYVQSRRLSYTNICFTHCQFCAFQAKPGDSRAYTLSPEDAVRELEKPENAGMRELHMTSGHNSKLDITYFEALFGALKARFPEVHLKAFTMVEIDYYARVSGLTVEAFQARCMAAGLESCPGGARRSSIPRSGRRSASARRMRMCGSGSPRSATARACPPTARCSTATSRNLGTAWTIC
jgi:aminodeoxyfutalosine synthase